MWVDEGPASIIYFPTACKCVTESLSLRSCTLPKMHSVVILKEMK